MTQSGSAYYKLTVKGHRTTPVNLLVEHAVLAELQIGQANPRSFEIYRGDSLDRAFVERYGQPEWVAPNVIRFKRLKINSEGRESHLLYENHSANVTECTLIEATDLFVVLDMQSASRITVSASGNPPAETVFLSARPCFTSDREASTTDIQLARPSNGFAGTYVVSFDGPNFSFRLDPLQKEQPLTSR